MTDNFKSVKSRISIEDRIIADDQPAFIIAEGACNHMTDMDMAKEMIDKAADAGVDAIKFQTYKAEKLVTASAKIYWEGQEISQLEYYGKLDKFGKKEYRQLFEYARNRGIVGFSTPFDLDSASMLHDLDMPLFKIASCDLPDKRLLRHISRFGKPIILSTGGSTLEEIETAITIIIESGNSEVILLACTLSYPAKNEDANLYRLRLLKNKFSQFIIGVSDHTEPDQNMIIPAISIALGARVIEKHYTLNRSLTGSGHFFSVNPNDLGMMVKNIRLTETIIGQKKDFHVLKVEQAARNNARRSIVAEIDIPKGTIITTEMLGIKRPGNGLSPLKIDELVGKKANVMIPKDRFLSESMICQK